MSLTPLDNLLIAWGNLPALTTVLEQNILFTRQLNAKAKNLDHYDMPTQQHLMQQPKVPLLLPKTSPRYPCTQQFLGTRDSCSAHCQHPECIVSIDRTAKC